MIKISIYNTTGSTYMFGMATRHRVCVPATEHGAGERMPLKAEQWEACAKELRRLCELNMLKLEASDGQVTHSVTFDQANAFFVREQAAKPAPAPVVPPPPAPWMTPDGIDSNPEDVPQT